MGHDRLTAEERRLRDEALRAGRVTRAPAPRRKVSPAPEPREAATSTPSAPKTYRLPEAMSVRAALEWAFGTECAQMDADVIGATSGGQRRGMSPEAVLEQRFMLGNVRIDTSPGRSNPADDAEVIASVVRATLAWNDAVWVADLARAGREPDAMVGVRPRLVPLAWTHGRGGHIAKRADAAELGVDGWGYVQRRNRKGILVREAVFYTPCTWTPTVSQIGAARRAYLDWWGHLLNVQVALEAAGLQRFRVTRDMPPMTPWRKGGGDG